MWLPSFLLIYFVSSTHSCIRGLFERTSATLHNEHSNKTEEEKPLECVPLKQAFQVPDTARKKLDEMRLRYCKVPKAASTMVRAILCDLYRRYRKIPFEQKFNEKMDSLTECQVNHWYRDEHFETKAWENEGKELAKFAVIRHPVDRFVSLYLHICGQSNLCSGVGIEKFAEQVYLMMLKDEKPDGMSAETYKHVKYHAQPQTWYCDIRTRSRKYHFVRFSFQKALMERNLLKVFTQAGIPKRFSKEALRHLHKSNTSHANERDKSEELRKWVMKSKRTMRFIRATFHSDFELLHFKA